MATFSSSGPSTLASTGIDGLDLILKGGLPREEMHLVSGSAGSGKTTIALRFLLAGVAAGESCLYVTLSQSAHALARIARAHGWSLDGIDVQQIGARELAEGKGTAQSVLHTADVELDELTAAMRAKITGNAPQRVVIDSLGVIALLADDRSRYHREVAVLSELLSERGCTSVFLVDMSSPDDGSAANGELYALAGSVTAVEQHVPEYGDVRRSLRIVKVRGVAYDGGHHNFRIRTGAIDLYPRLPRLPRPAEGGPAPADVGSGIERLDTLLGGGLERGSAALFVGPPGSGKSTLASVFLRAAAERGDQGSVFLFDERAESFVRRAASVGADLGPHLGSGRIHIEEMDTSSISAGEFAHAMRIAVEERGAKIVVIDSLTGYFNAMRNGGMLTVQMHELLLYLSRSGVLVLLLVTQAGFMTVGPDSSIDISYLSDTIVVLRSFEDRGTVRRCISATKKRQGEHETTIRELFIVPGSVRISEEVIGDMQNKLSGDPFPVPPRA